MHKKKKSVWKKILWLIRPYLHFLMLSFVFAGISALLTLYAPILIGNAVDLIIGKGSVDFDAIGRILFRLAGIIVITSAAQWLMNLCNNHITYRVVKDVRTKAFAKLQKLPLKYVDSHAYGETISRIITDVQQFSERFHRHYAYENDVLRKNKYSVSELKHRAMREAFEKEEESVPVFKSEEVVPYVPAFARKIEQESEEVNLGALRGTAMHRIMECYQFSSGMSAKEQVAGMLENEQITPEMNGLIRIPQVEYFVNSGVGKRMGEAEKSGKMYREKPFVMGFSDDQLEAFGFAEHTTVLEKVSEELTLIQGIIDVFWIEKDGIVLLDYKTDRVDTEKELSERYAAQLKLYGEALNRVYENETDAQGNPLKVKERLLYSFRLGKVIPV